MSFLFFFLLPSIIPFLLYFIRLSQELLPSSFLPSFFSSPFISFVHFLHQVFRLTFIINFQLILFNHSLIAVSLSCLSLPNYKLRGVYVWWSMQASSMLLAVWLSFIMLNPDYLEVKAKTQNRLPSCTFSVPPPHPPPLYFLYHHHHHYDSYTPHLGTKDDETRRTRLHIHLMHT